MSATLAQSGRARAALYISVPLAALGAFGYFAWSSRSRPSAPPVETRQWGQGTVLPVTQSAPIPAAASPQPAPAPVKEVAQAEPVVAPPPRIRVMSVYEQKEGMAEVNQRAAERYAERMKPRTAPSAAATDDPNVLTPGGSSEYAQRMRSTDFADTMPTPPNLPQQYTIKKNYRIPCLPDSPLSSEMVGPITCTTTQAVLSMDGSNILLPVGTEVHGTIERGLSNGDKRLFPIWTDMLTPKPYQQAIPLGSPSADELGRPGLPGDVNTHFWLKARDLALVSVIEMIGGVASSAASSGNGNSTFNLNTNGLQNSAQTLAQAAFGRELSQPDTLYRGQGQPIVIITNKYINLQRYYRNVVLR
jgi:type IV secretion system protein VirB10